MFSRFVACILLIVLMPLLLICALLIFITMGRPIFFVQRRPGLHERIFTMYKFRTMKLNIDSQICENDAQRLTCLGRFIRSWSLDELPQLINIMKGEMNFIGPRALLIEYLPLYNVRQKIRHNVKPGLTGLAQVNGRNALTWDKRLEMDVWYVENRSFFLNACIVLKTIVKTVRRDGISSQTHATCEKFDGRNV